MLTDLLGNQIPACVASVPELLEYQKAGYLRILAVIGKQRQTLLPNVPTFHELGVSGFENLAYYGLFGPPNIPKENMATIERMTKQSLEDTSLVEKLTALGLDVRYRNASQFKEQVQDYSREWQAIIASH
jgi:tripartite-type tricarboxylate transporter receptor subunit TctC